MSNSHAYALSGSSLVSFDLANPTAGAIISISGVTPTDTLVGIDFRPLNGLLYGLGVDPTGDTATLYVISTETGQARVVGIAGALGLPEQQIMASTSIRPSTASASPPMEQL